MSEAKRDNNFTKKQLRGLDMVMNKLMKKYSYIKGWRLSSIYENYAVTIYLDLYVDFFELADKYGYGVLNYWKKDLLQDPEKSRVGAISAYIGNKDGTSFDWGGPEREESFNLYYNLGKEMREYVNNLYLLLPSEYIINWESSFSSLVGDNLLPVSISFDNYIQKN
jgi:hypothetical protein